MPTVPLTCLPPLQSYDYFAELPYQMELWAGLAGYLLLRLLAMLTAVGVILLISCWEQRRGSISQPQRLSVSASYSHGSSGWARKTEKPFVKSVVYRHTQQRGRQTPTLNDPL
ncbi:MAG: hypothetical protein IIY70_05290 [Oscillospiraceae bacterium]|nr:hypothetical protein [Oscillospiraceae bacterium]